MDSDILSNGVKTMITHKTDMERYLAWKDLVTKVRSKLSEKELEDCYKIRNWLAVKALKELSK